MILLSFLSKTGVLGGSGGIKGYRIGAKHPSWLSFDGFLGVFGGYFMGGLWFRRRSF
jgi:hypothetical protein